MKLNTKLLTISALFIAALMLLSPISQTNTSGGGIGNSDLDFLNSLDINNNNFVLSADQNSYSEKVSISEITSSSERVLSTESGDIPSTTAITVFNIDELKIFSGIVNGTYKPNQSQQPIKSDFSGYTVILTGNLMFDDPDKAGESNFTPIGKDLSHKFNGTFDGQGHTISNLSVNIDSDSGDVYAGLFGVLGDKSTVKNLGIINSEISATSISNGFALSGGIAGYNYGTIENCYNTGTVTGLISGGIAGYQGAFTINKGTITNCYNTGTVNGSGNSGGIVGQILSGTITNCYNTEDVTGSNSGGIAGDNRLGEITNCYNTGTVNGSGNSGGIAGDNGSGTIENCYNTGAVTGSGNSGGIVGIHYGTIENCYNTGTVTGSGNSGGIAGVYGAITNCYYLKGCVSNDNYGGKELDRDAMNGLNLLSGTEENSTNLNKGQVSKPWSPDIFNVNDGYPILANVPTQINPSKSANEPPQSAVYVTLDDEKGQAENYLERFKLTNVDEVAATINCLNDQNKNITSYQWYTMNNKGDFIEVSEILSPGTIQETYYVKVTIDGYSYTSLTRTVSDTFIVMFDNNDGSDVKSIIVSNGKAISQPEDPTKTGYTFEGWYTSDDNGSTLSKKWNFSLDKVTSNMTLYAVWTPIPEPIYTLCLNSNDSTLQTKRYSGTYGTEITLKSASDFGWNESCTFIEWNSKSDGSGISYKEGDKFSLGSETWNLYAIWSDSSYHTVIFDSNGGNSIPSQSIQDGYRASEPTDPEKQGHSFKHWSLNGTKYDFNQSVKEDIILKAEYEVISYKVTFYYNGEIYYSTVADYNTSLGDRMPSLPSDKDKWNTSENGKGNNFTSDSLITSDISIYAVSESSISSILIIGGSAAAILAAIAAWLFMRSRYN